MRKELQKAFVELNAVLDQLKVWGGAAEKIERWRKDIESANVDVENVLYSMRLIMNGDNSEAINDEEYSWQQ